MKTKTNSFSQLVLLLLFALFLFSVTSIASAETSPDGTEIIDYTKNKKTTNSSVNNVKGCERWGNLEVPLPGGKKTICDFLNTGCPLAYYVGIIANMTMGLVASLSLIMITFSGYIYMTAGGDAGRVQKAKSVIVTSLLGIVLALGTYLLIRIVNPDMLKNDCSNSSYSITHRKIA